MLNYSAPKFSVLYCISLLTEIETSKTLSWKEMGLTQLFLIEIGRLPLPPLQGGLEFLQLCPSIVAYLAQFQTVPEDSLTLKSDVLCSKWNSIGP